MSDWSSRYVFPGLALSSPASARTQTRIRVGYEPALLPGPLTPRREGFREQEVLREILAALANELRDRGDIDERESFIAATFASAKGGGDGIGPTRRGKGVKIMGGSWIVMDFPWRSAPMRRIIMK